MLLEGMQLYNKLRCWTQPYLNYPIGEDNLISPASEWIL